MLLYAGYMECTVHLLASMPVCYIYRQQEGLTERTPDAIVAYFSSLEGSREERAFELAKNEYLAWLEHRTDRYTTVYGYLD